MFRGGEPRKDRREIEGRRLVMGWSLLGGHSCDPADVRRGHCPKCGTTWTRRDTPHSTADGLSGRDIRDENGDRYPLF